MYPTCLVFYVLSCFTFLLPCVFLCLMCLVCYVLLFLPCLVLHVFSCYTYLMLLSHVPRPTCFRFSLALYPSCSPALYYTSISSDVSFPIFSHASHVSRLLYFIISPIWVSSPAWTAVNHYDMKENYHNGFIYVM